MSELFERLFFGAMITVMVIIILALIVATYGALLLLFVPGLVWHYVAVRHEQEELRKWKEKFPNG